MSSSGVTRKVDQLGRVVLPVELRRTLGLREGDLVEVALDGDADPADQGRNRAASSVGAARTSATSRASASAPDASAASRIPEREGDLVGPPPGDAELGRDRGGGIASRGAALEGIAHRVDDGGVAHLGGGRATRARSRAHRGLPGRSRGSAASPRVPRQDLLVELRELTDHGDGSVGAAHGGEVGQRRRDPAGRLVHDGRADLRPRASRAGRADRRPCGGGTPRTRSGRSAARRGPGRR